MPKHINDFNCLIGDNEIRIHTEPNKQGKSEHGNVSQGLCLSNDKPVLFEQSEFDQSTAQFPCHVQLMLVCSASRESPIQLFCPRLFHVLHRRLV